MPSQHDPRFPFVVPTVILRPFRPLWEPLWEFLVELWEELFVDWTTLNNVQLAAVMDLSRGVRPHAPGRGSAAAKGLFEQTLSAGGHFAASTVATGVRASKSFVDAVDQVGSMWDDEML